MKKIMIICLSMLSIAWADEVNIQGLYAQYNQHVFAQDADAAKALFADVKTPIASLGSQDLADERIEAYAARGRPLDVRIIDPDITIVGGNMGYGVGDYNTYIRGRLKFTGDNLWSFAKIGDDWKIASVGWMPHGHTNVLPEISSRPEDILTLRDDFIVNTHQQLVVDSQYVRSDSIPFINTLNDTTMSPEQAVNNWTFDYIGSSDIEIHNEFTGVMKQAVQLENGETATDVWSVFTLDKRNWLINSVVRVPEAIPEPSSVILLSGTGFLIYCCRRRFC